MIELVGGRERLEYGFWFRSRFTFYCEMILGIFVIFGWSKGVDVNYIGDFELYIS